MATPYVLDWKKVGSIVNPILAAFKEGRLSADKTRKVLFALADDQARDG